MSSVPDWLFSLLGFTAMVCVLAFQALTVRLLWAWFVVPLGVPDVTVPHAYGLMLVLYLCTLQVRGAEKSLPKSLGTMFFVSVIALGTGFVASMYV